MKFLLLFNLLLLLLLLAGLTTIESKRKSRREFELTREDLEFYTRNHHSVEDYDFTTPVYIEQESMVSKRSVDSEPVISQEREVKFNAFGRLYHLRLQPNHWLLRQGLVVERVGAEGTITEEEISSRDCFYYASLISHIGESAGALTTCNGLRGLISHDDADIYITPLKDHHALRYRREVQDDFNGERAHIVYKRTSGRRQQTSDTMPSDLPSFDYYHNDDESIHYTYDEANDYDGNDTNTDDTFCEEIDVPGYTGDPDPSLEHSHSWDQGSIEGSNMSRPGPIFADRMAGEQEEGEHLQEGGQRYIELFVFVDDEMNEFHGSDITDYTLTLMNIVSRRYSEPSLKSQVRIAIVKIVVAETQQVKMTGQDGADHTLNVQANAAVLIREFCSWQYFLNPSSDEDPLHYDGAVLISRRNLYATSRNRRIYGLLGRASLGSICWSKDSCNINEDTGLEAAFTVTHELGHNLDLLHDPDYECANGRNIMSSSFVTGASGLFWSSCSAENFAKFLKTSASSCLRDAPSLEHQDVRMLPVDQLPGVKYGRLKQCQKAFGTAVKKLCQSSRMYVTCGRIGCQLSGSCKYTRVMEGTRCGVDLWCYQGFCHTSIGGIPGPIHGGWGEWKGDYTKCSRTCGTGVQYIRRYCDNPAPRFGGKACEGDMFVMETCNENPCPGVISSEDYRQRECALTNNKKFRYKYHNWTADLDGTVYGDKLCYLRCKSESAGFLQNRPPHKVSDGTKCWGEEEPDELRRTRRCVDKQCKEIGCDGVYGSGKLLDGCGKCQGTGRTCRLVSGDFREAPPVETRMYWHWITIPVGATMVNITNNNGNNFELALKIDGKFIVRAEGQRIPSQRYVVGDIHILFRIQFFVWEKIWILSGPTTKEIEIHGFNKIYEYDTLRRIRWKPPFRYEWYEPISDPVHYYWETYPTSECSSSCEGGNQTVMVKCIEEINGEGVKVNDRFCNETTKPSIYLQECNTHICPGPQWLIGDWGPCSVTCDEGLEERNVDCIEGSTLDVIPTIDCIMAKFGYRPNNTTPCYQQPCPTRGPTSPLPTQLEVETTMIKDTVHSTSDVETTMIKDTVHSTSDVETTMSTDNIHSTSDDTTMYSNITIEMTSSSSASSEQGKVPPLISIPDNACAKEYNCLNLILCLIIGVLVSCNKLNL